MQNVSKDTRLHRARPPAMETHGTYSVEENMTMGHTHFAMQNLLRDTRLRHAPANLIWLRRALQMRYLETRQQQVHDTEQSLAEN